MLGTVIFIGSMFSYGSLSALNYLSCGHNQLTDLDVSQNSLLTQLRCEANLLTDVNVSQNQLLNSIQCSENQITNLDLSQNSLLNTIYCHQNNLTYLNIANGNNLNVNKAWSNGNDELECIVVDDAIDVDNPPANWVKDPTSIYSHGDCCFLNTEVEIENNTLIAVATDVSYQWRARF